MVVAQQQSAICRRQMRETLSPGSAVGRRVDVCRRAAGRLGQVPFRQQHRGFDQRLASITAQSGQQRMSAATLLPGDGVLAISNSGRSKSVIEAVEIARSFGAATVALTRPDTPLAAIADMAIAVTIVESENVLLPTPSRYAHLAVIDTLAAGIAMKLGGRARESLRRVRYTLARIGVAIPTPSTDPSPFMKDQVTEE